MNKNAKILLTLGLLILSVALMGFQGEGPNDDDGPRADSAVCSDALEHPVALRIAERYADQGVTYEQVVAWFCDGFGLGEIMLAIETGELTGEPAGNLLQEKREGNGWGNVWRNRNLVKKAEDSEPPGQARRAGEDFTPPGQLRNSGADDAPGNSGNAPGQNQGQGQGQGKDKDNGNNGQGNQGNSPGQSGERGNSGNAPGQGDEAEGESTDDD